MSVFSVFITVAPQILSSYGCIQTADQLNCSCETVGNPPPALQWYLDGLPVNHSDRFAISSEPLNVSGLRSIITVSQPQQRDLSTLLCHSSNSLGSATQRFLVYSLEPHGLSLCSIQVLLIIGNYHNFQNFQNVAKCITDYAHRMTGPLLKKSSLLKSDPQQ